MDYKQDLTNEQVIWALVAVVVLLIIYLLLKQNFIATPLYTSGATQRYASEFTSTDQKPSILNSLAFVDFNDPSQLETPAEHFENSWRDRMSGISKKISNYGTQMVNRYASDKAKLATNNPKSEALEHELFANMRAEQHQFNM